MASSDSPTPSPREPERDNPSSPTIWFNVGQSAGVRYRFDSAHYEATGLYRYLDEQEKPVVFVDRGISAPTGDGRQENIATSDDLNRIAYQTAPLTIAMGDKLSGLASALDALAAAVKQVRECGERAHVDGGTVVCGRVLAGAPRYCEHHQAAIHRAITQLLAGGGTR